MTGQCCRRLPSHSPTAHPSTCQASRRERLTRSQLPLLTTSKNMVMGEFTTLAADPSLSELTIDSITQTSALATVTIEDAGSSIKTIQLRYRGVWRDPVAHDANQEHDG